MKKVDRLKEDFSVTDLCPNNLVAMMHRKRAQIHKLTAHVKLAKARAGGPYEEEEPMEEDKVEPMKQEEEELMEDDEEPVESGDLPRFYQTQGNTNIHFGAIRLALTFHGRKGLPAFSRIALVDTRFVEYQHVCIGTIQTTLNAGTIFITFYPNFNMPPNDPASLTALKAQIQIGGTPQVNTFQATFHYQMAYRVQNHSLDIMVPGQENSGDALLLDIDSNATQTCTYVLKQLSREELVKLLLEKWITNYEQIHKTPVQTTTAPEFVCHQNGLVEVKFSPQDRQGIFHTVNMIQPIEDPRPIQHCSYDVCNCDECLEEAYKVEYDEDLPKRKKGSQNKLKKIFENGDPNSENVVSQNQALKAILIQQRNLSKNQEALAGRVHTVENIINDSSQYCFPSSTESSFEDSSLIASSKAPEVLPIKDSKSSLSDEQDFSEDFENLFLAEPEPTVENTFDFDYDAEETTSVATPKGKKKVPRSDAKQKFTFDDIPPSKWRERSTEMLTWCSAELQFYDIDMVIKRFLTRCQGRLRDWYLSVGEYRQLQIQQVQSPEEFMHIIYAEFIRSLVEHTVRAREEFLKNKVLFISKERFRVTLQ
ncbi:hypothetical protein R6Q59_012361 [Mikania micrantha]